MTATKIQPGNDTHLTLLMAPHSLNFVTGADRAALLAYGRDVFAAGREAKCLTQIQVCVDLSEDEMADMKQSLSDAWRSGERMCIKPMPTYSMKAPAAPAAPAVDALAPVQALLDMHAELLDANPDTYFSLAFMRETGWMAWITDKPFRGPIINPDRQVLARGQGDTPAEACADAAQTKEGGVAA